MSLTMQGFNEEVICILRKRYPADLLATLQSQSYGALREVCDAFPDDSILPNAKLKRFLEVGASLTYLPMRFAEILEEILISTSEGMRHSRLSWICAA